MRYTVMDRATGDCFGNHTKAEAIARARAMEINWGYRKKFIVIEMPKTFGERS